MRERERESDLGQRGDLGSAVPAIRAVNQDRTALTHPLHHKIPSRDTALDVTRPFAGCEHLLPRARSVEQHRPSGKDFRASRIWGNEKPRPCEIMTNERRRISARSKRR